LQIWSRHSASQLLPPSKLSDGIDIVSMTKNTFIEHPDATTMQREGARRRTRSVPKNMGSTKNDLETTCHALTYQHQSVAPTEAVKPLSRHKITLEKKGCGLGLDVSCEGEPGAESLLIEDVGPGPVELWNLSHFDEIKVQAGDRILEINGIAGDASAMLNALQVSNTVELTLDLSSQKVLLNGQMNMSSEFAAVHSMMTAIEVSRCSSALLVLLRRCWIGLAGPLVNYSVEESVVPSSIRCTKNILGTC